MRLQHAWTLYLLIFIHNQGLAAEKIRAASMDLVAKAGVEPSMASLLSDALRSEIHDSGAFELMNREDMDAILKEIKYQNSGACDTTNCVVEMGQALGVQKMISGSVGKFGATFAVNLKMVDIRLAKNDVLFTEYHKGKEDDLPDFIRAIAKRLLKEAGNAASEAPEKKETTPAKAVAVKTPAPSKPAPTVVAAKAQAPDKKAVKEEGRSKAASVVRPRPARSPALAALIGLIPGAGQAYNGQKGKALIAGALGLGGIIGMVVTKGSAENARDAYAAADGTADFDALVSDFDSKRSGNQAMLGVTLGVAVLSSVDSFISASGNRKNRLGLKLSPDKLEASYAFAF